MDSTGLEKEHVVVFARPLLPFCDWNLPRRLLVKLVSNAYEREGLRVLRSRILVEAILPAGEGLKGLLVSDVVNECAAVSTAVERVAE